MFEIIKTILKLIHLLFTQKIEKDRERKEKKKEILQDVKKAIQDEDISTLNDALRRAGRM